MLPSSIPGKRMKPITWRNSQVVEACREIDILQLSRRSLRNIRRDPLGLASGVQLLGAAVCKRLDHRSNVTRHVTRGK